ncbi:MAG TPA: pyridoxal phosphate-dependent aminotransferase [Desulfatiglandales bacterium]|nr:pyridoxal phosphate-dependent aminotransferase [Desulfatiglandales bacterium]
MTVAIKIQSAMKKSSWIRRMFEDGIRRKRLFGDDNVFDFSLGNPIIEPPNEFKRILKKLASDKGTGRHAYMPNAGYEETRKAVAHYLTVHNQGRPSSGDIVMTVGAGGALNIILKTILDPDDEVIIPSPYFVEYNFYIDNHQGIPVVAKTMPDFSLDLDAIEEAFTEKTKAVLINSPNNPTGKVYSEGELRELAGLLYERGERLGRPVYLISDEPYRKIVYDGIEVPGIFNLYRESFVANSFSKDLSLPGERIGYAAVNPDISEKSLIIDGMILANRILGYVNAPALMQRAIIELLDVSVDVYLYQKKRDMLCSGLASLGYQYIKPQGAFYLFPKSPIEDDVEFVSALQEENILTVPGSGFGCPGHFRIAYCVHDSVIEGSMKGFGNAINKYM